MATLDVRNSTNKVLRQVEVGAEVFERPVKPSVLHAAIVHLEAGMRQGTHATKTRSDVRGTTRKPWRQKGTGRARAGDTRSPLWRKGGTVHGPQPRDHSTSFPRMKMRRALQMALSAKYRGGRICVVDELAVSEAKTRAVVAMLKGLELDGRTLIYDPAASADLVRAARNLPGCKVVSGFGLTVRDLLYYDNLLTSEAGIARIGEALR